MSGTDLAENRTRGRPLRLSDAVIDDLADGIRAGLTVAKACARTGIPYSTLAAWQQRGRELRATKERPRTQRDRLAARLLVEIERARADLEAELVGHVLAAARWRDGEEGRPREWRAAAFLIGQVGISDLRLGSPDPLAVESDDDGLSAEADVIDAEDVDLAEDEETLLRDRLRRLRRSASVSTNPAATAALQRQISQTEDRILALRPTAATGDPATLSRDQYVAQLRAAASAMAEADLSILVEVWLERHGLPAGDLRRFAEEWLARVHPAH